MSVRSFVRASPFSRTSETARSLNVGFGPPASRIRSTRSRSRFRILTEGSGVVLRGIGNTKFAVSFSPGEPSPASSRPLQAGRSGARRAARYTDRVEQLVFRCCCRTLLSTGQTSGWCGQRAAPVVVSAGLAAGGGVRSSAVDPGIPLGPGLLATCVVFHGPHVRIASARMSATTITTNLRLIEPSRS
jgi:hypothetical protein